MKGRGRYRRRGQPRPQIQKPLVGVSFEEFKRVLSPVFQRHLKRGIVLSDREVRQEAEKRGIAALPRHLTQFRRSWLSLRRFKEIRAPRSPAFQSVFRARYATLFLDVAFLGDKRHNEGHVGFLLGVELFSTQMAALPIKRRTLEGFEDAIDRLFALSVFRQVTVTLSDREKALYSRTFARRMRAKYGIQLHYLSLRSKSYLAERMIRYLKTRLSALMDANGTKTWTTFLPGLIQRYNRGKVPGTDFRRVDIDARNVHRFLEQQRGLVNYPALLNTSRIHAKSIRNKTWLKRLFKYQDKERVLVSLKVIGGVDKRAFYKPSVHGFFGATVYEVAARFLVTTRSLAVLAGIRRNKSCFKKMSDINTRFFFFFFQYTNSNDWKAGRL